MDIMNISLRICKATITIHNDRYLTHNLHTYQMLRLVAYV